MSIFTTLRAATSEIFSLVDPKWTPTFQHLGLQNQTTSGEWITPRLAMVFSAYFAAIRNISEDIGKMSRGVYKRGKNIREEAFDHPVQAALDSPCTECAPMAFFETLTSHALGYQGGYAEIVRNGRQQISELRPLDPEMVNIQRDESGEIFYRVNMRNGAGVDLNPADVLHVHGLGYNAVTGFIMSAIARESLGFGVAAQRYSSAFFGNGAVASGVIEHPGKLSPEARQNLADSFDAKHKGAQRAHGTIVLHEGAKFNATSFDSQKAMMIEALNWAVEDVARWFRMPPHKLQQLLRATFSNIEQQNIEYVVDCLLSWVSRWEGELNRKLFNRGEPYYVKFNMSALLRGDMAARAAFYHSMQQDGNLSTNEVRAFEDWNPVDGGDEYRVQLNMVGIKDLPSPKTEQGASPATTQAPTGAGAIAVAKMAGAILGRLYAREEKASRKWSGKTPEQAIALLTDFVEGHRKDYVDELTHIAEAFATIIPLSGGALTSTVNLQANDIRDSLRAMLVEDGQYFNLEEIMQRRIESAEADGLKFINRLAKSASAEGN